MEDKSYNEYGLPDYLQESIKAYTENENTTLWDCYYCELQCDINAAEREDDITSMQADYLRHKYLGIVRD